MTSDELQRHCRVVTHLARAMTLGSHQVTLHGLFLFQGTAVTRARAHAHSVYEAQLMLQGRAVCVTEGRRQMVTPGQITLHAPQMPHAWQGIAAPFQRLTFWFNMTPVLPLHPPEEWPHLPQLFTELDSLLADIATRPPGWTERVVLHASVMLSWILSQTEWPTTDVPDFSDGSSLLQLLDRFLHDNLHRPLARQEIADFLGISERTLTRQLHQLTGGTLSERLEFRRIERARVLLEQTDASLQTICERVGYSNPAYFCRRFHRRVGVTPGEYRRNQGVISPS